MQKINPTISDRELPAFRKSLDQWLVDIINGRRKTSGLAQELSKAEEAVSDLTLGETELLVDIANCRGLVAGTENLGGFLVPVEQSDFAAALRPYAAVVAAGAQTIQAQGNKPIVKELTATTGQALSETDPVIEGVENFGQLTLSPHRLSCYLTYDKQLAAQSNVEGIVADSLPRSVGAGINRQALVGSGILGEAQGIFNTAGTQSVTISGAFTWANALAFVSKVSGQFADEPSMAFIGHPDVRAKLAAAARAAGFDFIWKDNETIAGKRALTSTDSPATGLVCGDWSKFVICMFNPNRLTVDPYELKKQAKIAVVATGYFDLGPIWPNVFAVNSGSVVA
jgi:HK97 family phage major capsid protein